LNQNPFFSIGITTYNRIDLLRYSLLNILEQKFKDFEVIIGNDYLSEPITSEKIGIDDPRIIIINNEKNLGELGNMNMLLSKARGTYFTWQFDDDMCSPCYLINAYKSLEKYNFPFCLYTSLAYIYGRANFKFPGQHNISSHLYSGPDFLRSFLSGKNKVMGSAGVYKTDFLRDIGGAIQLSAGRMAVYSEYLMIFKSCLRSSIVYINSELVAFRVHENSWSGTCAEAQLYMEAGINLLRASIPIFSDPIIIHDYAKNLTSLLKSIISLVVTKNRIAGIKINDDDLREYYMLIIKEFNTLTPELKDISVDCLNSASKHIPVFRAKAFLRKRLPTRYLRYAHFLTSIISRYTNKSF
jgi:glycosyltransferase involved in cell wall biosynthesis